MSPENIQNANNLEEQLNLVASQLGEHFDSVQIIASKQYGESDEYVRFSAGSGNYYARLGSTKEYIIAKDEELKIGLRQKAMEG